MDLFSGDNTLYPDGRDSLADVTGTYGITKAVLVDQRRPPDILSCVGTRVQRKAGKYTEPVSRLALNFRPLVFEVLGGYLDPAFTEFIQHRSRLIANLTSLPYSAIYDNNVTRLDCLIRNHYGTLVIGRSLTLQRARNQVHHYDMPEFLNPPVVVLEPQFIEDD